MILLLPHPLNSASCLSFSVCLCIAGRTYKRERGGGGGGGVKFYDDEKAWSSTYRVAAIFPEHFQSFTVALKTFLLLILLPQTDSAVCRSINKTIIQIRAKLNQHQATRAVIVCGLRAMKAIMTYGNINKSPVYDVERKFEHFQNNMRI
jgi:hypothetical protein